MASTGGVGIGSPGTIGGIKAPKPSLPASPIKVKNPLAGQTRAQTDARAESWRQYLPGGWTNGTGAKPAKPTAPTTPPGSTGTGTTTTTAPTAPSPYDATYYVDLANATLAANNKIGTYNSDIANGKTNLGNTLSQLAYNQGLATTKDQDAENAKGGFAQGALGQTLGQLGHAYLTTESTDANKYAQDAASWNTAISGVRQGLSIEQIALGLASTARQAALTAKDPGASGGTAGTTTTTGGAAGAPAPTGAKGTSTAPKVLSTRAQARSSRGRGGGTHSGPPIRTTPQRTTTTGGAGV